MTGYGYEDGRAPRGRAEVPPAPPPRRRARRGGADLIPVEDETTYLPVISAEPMPAPERPKSKRMSKRAVRRHRDASAGVGGGRPTVGDRIRAVIRGFGELFITSGLVILLFAAYMIWGKTAEINDHQDDLSTQLEEEWEKNPEAVPLPGDAFARLYMPVVKEDPFVIVEGVTPEDIEEAPGHYPKSQMPGEVGNFAIAGHNLPAIFRHIVKLRAGDKMVVETADSFYIYEVTEHEIVSPYAVEVVAPVPGDPDSKVKDAEDPMMTLTTCHPWWDNYERYVVHGKLVDTKPRADGIPPEALEK